MATTNLKSSVYAEEIFELAEGKKDEMFYNSSAEHAVIVHQALMKTAERYVCIYSSSMCSEISNNPDYCYYMKSFLEGSKDRKINILLTDYSNDFWNKEVGKLLSRYPQQVSIKKYDGTVYYKDSPVHFTVTDDRAYRLETDIENHMAFGNFNSEEQARALKEVFDKMFNSMLAESVFSPC